SGQRRQLLLRPPVNAQRAFQITALKMMKSSRRLNQGVQEFTLSAFGFHPDFLQRFVALEKSPGVEQLDASEILGRQIVHLPKSIAWD
ncbi:MAG TPA: hypothetical protein VJ810_39855, partial [Blastocatellia bacterium]|nr:hypothetical protein [Blastocatellia bacterium]